MNDMSVLYHARVPTLLWGAPGTGKTATLEGLARRIGADLFVPHVRAPEDVAVPVARDGHVEVVPVAEFAEAAKAAQAGRRVIVFVDELTTLPPAVQAAVLRFLDSGRVGGVSLPPSVWRAAAANPPDLAAGGWDLEPPTANRLAHLEWSVQADEWADHFARWDWPDLTGGDFVELGSPEWDDLWARARALVASFVRSQPHLLLRVPDEPTSRGRAWPSPRTWDYASRVLAAARCEVVRASGAIAACVGTAAGLQFVQWARSLDLPTPEDLLRDPGLLRRIQRSDVQYAALVALAAHISSRLPNLWQQAWEVAGVAAEVCRDVAAGTVVRELCRWYRKNPGSRVTLPPSFERYAELVRLARGEG